jgi:hypothetical protein
VLLALHQVVNQFIVTSQSILYFRVTAWARLTGQENGGSMSLSGITHMVHNFVAQSKYAIKVSIIN